MRTDIRLGFVRTVATGLWPFIVPNGGFGSEHSEKETVETRVRPCFLAVYRYYCLDKKNICLNLQRTNIPYTSVQANIFFSRLIVRSYGGQVLRWLLQKTAYYGYWIVSVFYSIAIFDSK